MLIDKLKLYPNQSQPSYAASSGGSGTQQSNNNSTIQSTIQSNNNSTIQSNNNSTIQSNNNSTIQSTIQSTTTNTTNAGRTGTNTPSSNSAGSNLKGPAGNIKTGAISAPSAPSIPVTPSYALQPIPPIIPIGDQTVYINSGSTYVSNNNNIISRNEAGSLQFEETSIDYNNLIIEPIIETYTNKSFINAIDTQFKFFKFPAKIGVDGNLDLDLNINFDVTDSGVDPITGFNTIAVTDTVGDYIPLPLSYGSNSGFRKVPFNKTLDGASIDMDEYSFVLTPDKIKYLKDSNKTIKITGAGTYVASANNNTGIFLSLGRHMPKVYRGWDTGNGSSFTYPQNTLRTFGGKKVPGDYTTTSAQGANGTTIPHDSKYVYMKFEFIINPSDFRQYDQYHINHVAGGPAVLLRQTAIFQTELIDDPGPGGYGNFSLH